MFLQHLAVFPPEKMGSNSSSLSQDLLNELSELTYLHRVEILHIFKRFRRIDPLGVSTSLDYRIRGDEIMNEFHEIKVSWRRGVLKWRRRRDLGGSQCREVLRADVGDARRVWSGAGVQGRRRRDIPEKTPQASGGVVRDESRVREILERRCREWNPCNPYADRLVDVFSSYGDGHLSFEDILDLFSALSENCPSVVKARWVFKILGEWLSTFSYLHPRKYYMFVNYLSGFKSRHLWANRKQENLLTKWATVAKWLDCSPPTSANQVQSPAGSLPDFRKWESCRTMPLVGGFSRGSPQATTQTHVVASLPSSHVPCVLFADFDEDSKLSEFDLSTMVERLCGERFYGGHRLSAEDSYRTLSSQEKKEIARKLSASVSPKNTSHKVLRKRVRLYAYKVQIMQELTPEDKTTALPVGLVIAEMDVGKMGSITANEFVHAVMKMPDFSRTFTLRP
ncbi:hypothetical protein PR048_029568 [Dryococelus australis]|uniref:EF-hand domain-containing protein n=1 Tax=Dryococelus australis TaxID=614101 RepID=A0ABQ9GDR6_9NEOP|nr:hypothetical protein PR048_029568 [Dryococelus australis]